METRSLTDRWRHRLFGILETTDSGMPLKEAALGGKARRLDRAPDRLRRRRLCAMGWRAAAKDHLGDVLPVTRNEYLALDVIAFSESEARWPLPVAVFELENGKDDDRVAYSLWKVLCVRAALRVVFAYRRDAEEGTELVGRLTDSLIGGLSIADRLAITGETSLIIGNRGVRIPSPTDTSRPGHSRRTPGGSTGSEPGKQARPGVPRRSQAVRLEEGAGTDDPLLSASPRIAAQFGSDSPKPAQRASESSLTTRPARSASE